MSSDKELATFPTFLNEPERMIYWTFEEALAFAGPSLTIGMFGFGLFDFFSIPLGCLVGYACFEILRFTSNTKYGNIRAALFYWYFPSKGFYPFPPSHIREYVG